MEGAATSMSTLTTAFTDILTWAITSMTSFVSWVVSTPLMLAVVALFFIGFVVSLFVRAFHSV